RHWPADRAAGRHNDHNHRRQRRGKQYQLVHWNSNAGDDAMRRNARRGLVLVLVLIVIAMLSLGAYSFTNLMLAHHEAAVMTGRQTQARSLVDSGVTAVQLFLSQPEADRNSTGGIFDNAEHFRGVAVLTD